MLEIQIILQKFLQTADLVSNYYKWKSDINGGPKWKLIKDWLHQHFVKML